MPQLGIVQQVPPNVFNVRKYGAVGNGVHDDTRAIAAAIADASQSGGAVYLPGGTPGVNTTLYMTDPITTIVPGVWVKSDGYQAATLMLNPGCNADLIQTANFPSLTGTNSTNSPYNFGIVGLTLDGNGANQSAGSGTSPGRCLSIYGYGYTLDNLRIRNAYVDGMYSEWSTSSNSPGNDSMEAFIGFIKIHNCGGDGMIWCGPHDSVVETFIAFNCGTVGNHNTHLRLPSTTNQGVATRFNKVHCWSGNVDYQAVVHDTFIGMQEVILEGATIGQMYVDNAITMKDCWLFSGGTNSNLTKGLIMGTGPSSQAAHSTITNLDVHDCLLGAIDVQQAGKYSLIEAHVYHIRNPINTTSSTAVSAPGTQDIVLAGGTTNIVVGMALEIDRNGVNHEVVTVNSFNSGANTINCTFATVHTGTYTVENASIIGTPDATNEVKVHISGITGGLQDGTIHRMPGAVIITPASIYQTPLKLNQVAGQTAPMLGVMNGGTFLAGFSATGSLSVGIQPNTTIEGLFQSQGDTHKPLVAVAFSATQSSKMLDLQDYIFRSMAGYDAFGRPFASSLTQPTLAALVGAGTSAPTPLLLTGACDWCGQLEWGTGTGSSAASGQVQVTFANAYATAPRMVIVKEANSATSALKAFSANVTNTGFQVWLQSNPTDSKAVSFYQVSYLVIE